MESFVERIVFYGEETAFGVGHFTEVVVDDFADLARGLDAIVFGVLGAIAG